MTYNNPALDYNDPNNSYNGSVPTPSVAPEAIPVRAGGTLLGVTPWQVWIQTKGGSTRLARLPVNSFSFTRVLDDMSSAAVTIPFSGSSYDYELDIFSNLRPFYHEIVIYHGDYGAWTGPITDFTYSYNQISLEARDMFQWFERRYNPKYRTFEQVDMSDIFRQLIEDVLESDPDINMTISHSPTGIKIDRKIDLEESKIGDELRSLARSGIDFTVINREIICNGKEISVPPITIVDNDINAAKVTYKGLSMVTKVTMLGQRDSKLRAASQPEGRAGGSDPFLGILEARIDDSSIQDPVEAAEAAQTYLDMNHTPTPEITFQLRTDAGYTLDMFIPGCRVNFFANIGPQTINDVFRLKNLTISVVTTDTQQSEQISLTLIPLGSVS